MESDARALAREIMEIQRRGHENLQLYTERDYMLGRLLHLTDELCREVLDRKYIVSAQRHALEAAATLDAPALGGECRDEETRRLRAARTSALVALALVATDAD